jgi:3-dehydroquinate synthase
MGIVSAAQLSVQKGWLTKQDVERIEKILTAAQLPIRLQGRLDCDKILAAMAVDKKFADTKPRLILLSAIGKATIVTDLSWDQVRQVI